MDGQILPLTALAAGKSGVVVRCEGPLAPRLLALGLTAGTRVRCLQKGPPGGAAVFYLRGRTVALREADAQKILVRL